MSKVSLVMPRTDQAPVRKVSQSSRQSSRASLYSIQEGGSRHSVYSMGGLSGASTIGPWGDAFHPSTSSLPRRASSASVAAYTEPLLMEEEARDSMYGTMSKASMRYYDRRSQHQQPVGKSFPPDITADGSSLTLAAASLITGRGEA